MRKVYNPETQAVWTRHYINQANQSGAGFVGLPYQRGSGLGSLFRGLLRALAPIAKSVGRSIGKQALTTGAEIATDVVSGKSIKEAAAQRGKQGVAKLMTKAASKLQEGKGIGKRPKRSKAAKPIKRQTKRRKIEDQLGTYYE